VPKTVRVGLTGGIGSGKSTVANMWVQRGATLVDADAIARQLTAPGGAAMPTIRQIFGDAMVTQEGALDREKMRALAFNDPQAKHKLEHIIHPMVTAQATAQTEAAVAQSAPCLVLDIPLLVESGHWRQKLDAVLVIDCLPETQVARAMARSGLTQQAAKAVVAAQATRAARLAAADAVIYNEGLSLAQLESQVVQVGRRFGL
jgi:dephospho-CoA kinase